MATNEPGMHPPSPRRTIELPPPGLPPPSRFTFIPPPPYVWARWVNIAMGAWLFVSPFVWPHSATSDANSWVVGLSIMIVGIAALYVPQTRWVNTALSVWLFFSTLVFAQGAPGTMWNNLIVALIVFLASLLPGGLGPSAGSNGAGRVAPP